MLSGDQPTEPLPDPEADGGNEDGGAALAGRHAPETGPAARRDSAGDEAANGGPEVTHSPAAASAASGRSPVGDRAAQPDGHGSREDADQAPGRRRTASPTEAALVAARSAPSSAPVAPTDDKPAGAAARQPPARQLSPRARLARLAGALETAEPDRIAASAASGQPVDAPATTAMVRPRRAPDRADDYEATDDEAAASGSEVAASGAARTGGATAVVRSRGGTGLPPELSPRANLDGGQPRRHGLVHALVVGLAAMVSCAVFLVVVLGYGATRYFDGRLKRTDLSADRVEGTRPPAVPHGRETWLLVGSDVRTGADRAEVGGSRSDTMMIAYLGSNGSTTLVSVPRDLKVTIPAFTDSAGEHHSAHTDKINSAFNLGGPALLVRTLENVSNVRIDHFAEIDFGGFKQMSNVLGGVQVCMVSDPYREYVAEDGRTSTNLNDPMSGFRGQVGENLLEGDNALAFVRQRHGFANGDYSRIERQQAFLAAVFRKVNSGDLLTDPAKLTGFLNAVTSAVTVDSGTRLTDLRTLALRTHAMSAGQVQFTTIPLSGAVSSPVYYALYDPGTVRSFFQQIIAGDDRSPAAAPTPSLAPTPAVDPSQIRVTVLNGSPSGGAATRVAAKLRAAGYQVVRVGTNGSRAVTRTEVRYPAALSAAASRLLADVPGASAVPVDATASPSTAATTPAAGSSAAADGMITLVVGEDLANGDTSVVATPTAGTATPAPYYTQAPVSADAGCVK